MKKFYSPKTQPNDRSREARPNFPQDRPQKRPLRNLSPQNAAQIPDNWIWGEHSVEACAESCPEELLEVFIERKVAGSLAKLLKKLSGCTVSQVEKLPRFLAEKRTQGVAAKIKNFPVEGIEKFYDQTIDANSQILVLDRVQDTQNFGAILRSAAALGAKSVIIGSREQAPVNGTVAQVSAGNLFKLKIFVCHNLAKTCEKLKELGFALLALEGAGEPLETVLKSFEQSSIAWILGAEEDGIQSALLKCADKKVGIPMCAGVESLNVSNSAAIALYEGFKVRKV